jgi:hypothetical protein
MPIHHVIGGYAFLSTDGCMKEDIVALLQTPQFSSPHAMVTVSELFEDGIIVARKMYVWDQ